MLLLRVHVKSSSMFPYS